MAPILPGLAPKRSDTNIGALHGQMRKPARQHPLDETEELPVRTRPDRRLTNRERDQLRITDKRRPAAASRDPILISENVRCNHEGFQIRHLELRSRKGHRLEALLCRTPGPCGTQPTFTSAL